MVSGFGGFSERCSQRLGSGINNFLFFMLLCCEPHSHMEQRIRFAFDAKFFAHKLSSIGCKCHLKAAEMCRMITSDALLDS